MKEAKEYHFKSKFLVFELICTVIALAVLLFLFANLYDNPLLLLIISVLPGCLFYFQLYSFRITLQFNKYDKDKKIIIDEARTTLTMIQRDVTIKVNNDEVDKVELYQQNSLGK